MKRMHFTGCTGKKGFSLMEMAVVLAVISLVSLAVVSFTVLVSTRSAYSTAKLKMMEDRQMTRVVLEGWLDNVTAANADIEVGGDKLIATLPNAATYTARLSNDRVVADVPNGPNLTFPVSTLTSLTFDQMENATGDTIYFCTARYELPNPTGAPVRGSFTFTLSSHIGDVYDVYEEVSEDATEP